MSDAARYIGMAKKAGAIEIGETNSGAAVRSGKAKLLMLAADASDNAKSRAEGFVFGRQTPLIRLPLTKAELSELSGEGGCSMAAFTDTGLAAAFLTRLTEERPEYAAVSGELSARYEKEKMRKQEAAAREKNKRAGMRRKKH